METNSCVLESTGPDCSHSSFPYCFPICFDGTYHNDNGTPHDTDDDFCEADNNGNNTQPPVQNIDLSNISDTCKSEYVSDRPGVVARTVCEYTGSDQNIRVPNGVSSTKVKAWGAGGGGPSYGGEF